MVVTETAPVQKCDTIKTKVTGTAMQVHKFIGHKIKVIKSMTVLGQELKCNEVVRKRLLLPSSNTAQVI